MHRLKSFAYQYPSVTSLVVIAVFTFVTEAADLAPFLSRYLGRQGAAYASGAIAQGLSSVVLAAIIARLGLSRKAGFTGRREWRQVWLAWPIVLLGLLVAWPLLDGSLRIDTAQPLVIVLYLLVYLSTGFYEEILCRGFMLTIMIRKWGHTRRGVYLAVLTSSAIFGALHVVSLFLGRISLLASLTQVLYATFFGVFFAACVLRNHSIWPAILFHALFDMCSDLNAIAVGGAFGQVSSTNSTPADALGTIAVTLPLLIYGLVILRKVEPARGTPDNGTRKRPASCPVG